MQIDNRSGFAMKPTSPQYKLLAIGTDLAVEPVWQYEELPPFLLLQLTPLDLLEVSDSELLRAVWFWSRRPRLMFHDRMGLMFVALSVFVSLFIAFAHWPETSIAKRVAEVIIIFFEVVVEIYTIGYRLNFLRWRREYERSIGRLIRTLRPGV